LRQGRNGNDAAVTPRTTVCARSLSLLAAVVAGATLTMAGCGDDGSDVPTSVPAEAPVATGGTVGAPQTGDTEATSPGTLETDPLSTNETPANSAEGTVP
jgi:hypothetical protein